MISLRFAAASIAIGATVTALTAVYSQPSDEYCARTPPPRGLVARCQSLTLNVPGSEEELRTALKSWMKTCVSSNRAAGLIEAADDNVVAMWALMKDLSRTRSITILPEYEPLSFRREGQLCYGVESATFVIKGSQSVVEESGPTDVNYLPPPQSTGFITDPTDEQIKQAAKAATVAIESSVHQDNPGIARFRGVLEGMAKYGAAYDDTWYAVAPTPPYGGACFNDTIRNKCLPSDEALKNCTRRLRVQLVTHYVDRKDRPDKLREAMEGLNSDLFRSFQYFRLMHASDSAAPFCSVLHQVMMPKISDLATRGLDKSPPSALYSNY